MAHVLHVIATRRSWEFLLWSAYDRNSDLMSRYLPASRFRGFAANKVLFAIKSIANAGWPDMIIISHINLALIGLLVKWLNPKCRVWLVAHGIEVWRPLSRTQCAFLKKCEKVLCVSNYTRQQMISHHQIAPARCEVVNNAVDPFLDLPGTFAKPSCLLNKFGLSEKAPVIFSLSRLASTEQYKGHDHVIQAIGRLKNIFPDIRYILGGQYDQQEVMRIKEIIQSAQADEHVILTGFIPEVELSDYFLLADLFVLPSKKEGFGIVFIEAMAYGLPVICGNADGSVDAIRSGQLGKAVNPDDLKELENEIIAYFKKPHTVSEKKGLQQNCLKYFGEAEYAARLEMLILDDLKWKSGT